MGGRLGERGRGALEGRVSGTEGEMREGEVKGSLQPIRPVAPKRRMDGICEVR
jgi:hypothetical protein